MSVIESLLGPRPTGAGLNPRTLLVEDDVIVNLVEDETREELTVYSVPGRVSQAHEPAGTHRALADRVPLGEGRAAGVSVLTTDPATQEMFIADVWPRASLDLTTFAGHLRGHADRHRFWRAELREGVDTENNAEARR